MSRPSCPMPPRWLALTLLVPLVATGLLTATAASHAAAPKPMSVLIELAAREPLPDGKPSRGAWDVELVIAKDGRWLARGEAGQLDAQTLADLRRTLSRTRLALAKAQVAPCPDDGLRRALRLRSSRGNLLWWAPCGRRPSPAVEALIAAARAAVRHADRGPGDPVVHPGDPGDPVVRPGDPATPPSDAPAAVLVTYSEMRYHDFDLDGAGGVVVRADGSWSAGRRAGTLTAAELASLRALIAAARDGEPADKKRDRMMQCAARLDGEGKLTIANGPTFGFSIPCGWPQGAVGALIGRLNALGRPAHGLPSP